MWHCLLNLLMMFLKVLFQYFRFYSHDSSFVHGGIEKPGEELPPVMGQAVSNHRILTLHNA